MWDNKKLVKVNIKLDYNSMVKINNIILSKIHEALIVKDLFFLHQAESQKYEASFFF